MPLLGEMFYNEHQYDQNNIHKICTKTCLLYFYYYLLFYAGIDNSDKIFVLLNDPDTMDIYQTDYDKEIFPKIHSSKYNITKNLIPSIPAKYIKL